jgi:hypothetical protein
MDVALGVALIAVGAAAATAAIALRSRIRVAAWSLALAAAGACLGAGALLLEAREVEAVDWMVTLVIAAIATPVHVIVVTGPPRPGAAA